MIKINVMQIIAMHTMRSKISKRAAIALLVIAFIIPSQMVLALNSASALSGAYFIQGEENIKLKNNDQLKMDMQSDIENSIDIENVAKNDNFDKNLNKNENENSNDSLSASITERFALYYFRDGIELDPEYLDNKEQMEHINEYLSNSPQIDSITIFAYASPEGVYEHNVWLSKRRAEVAKQYILNVNPNLDPSKIILKPMAENWEGLYDEVYENYHRYDRDFILKTIKDTTISDDTKKWRIGQSNEGISWRYLIIHNMPRLRLATWICVWESPLAEAQITELEPVEIVEEDIFVEDFPLELSETVVNPRPLKEKLTILAFKTNMLYDLVTALNAEVEIPIGRHFSLMVEDVFPWWTWGPNDKKYAFQMWEIGVEPRVWFALNDKRDRLCGHFVGAYVMSSKYDFQNNYDLCYQGEYWSTGLTYGFSLPLGKVMNLECSLSAGYLKSDYRHYQPDPAYEHLYRDKYKVGVFQYFGPTKLKISLVLPITIWRRVK